MSRLEKAIETFLETTDRRGAMPVPWQWRKGRDWLSTRFKDEFRGLYETAVGKNDFVVLTTLMGFLEHRKDKKIWNPYIWEMWRNELNAAADSYAESTYNIPWPDKRRPYFGQAAERLAELVEFATQEPTPKTEKELLKMLDERCDVIRREKLY